ncbi:LysR family transcriptional regulator [Rhodoferax aquaticus]|uniref:LysR family transcriptional regulator n=2 Tax=Rhodoferax aquaticus TaxID=2527691 RepID=A0A515EVZ7_9BURK|nr:LysR family transcriptional regulator [Rhodoferax aquaticus]
MAVFSQVVDSGGFSAAARQLRLTTSAVSRHVTRLEQQLGGRLLQRTTRSIKLTELGAQVYAGCARMLSTAREVHTLAGSYSARPNGLVRLTAPVVFGQVWLAPRLPGFLARYPDVSVQLSLVDRNVDLVEDGVDLAIRISRELSPTLAARTVCAMRYVLVASPDYLATYGVPAHPADLQTHACIYLGYGAYGDTWTLHPLAQGADAKTPPKGKATGQGKGKRSESVALDDTVQVKVASRAAVNNSAAIMAMVQAHGGIGLVPDFSAQAALASGAVHHVLPDWAMGEPYTGTVYAVYTPGPHLPLKTRALIDYLVA